MRWRMEEGAWGHWRGSNRTSRPRRLGWGGQVGPGGAKLDRGGWQARPWCGLGCLGCLGQGNLEGTTRVIMVGSHTC